MDTEQGKKEAYRFIVLIPHRDSLRPLEEYRVRLFATGFPGAWSFPMAAPLASVSHFFSGDELKGLGRNIRELTKETDGKILCSGSVLAKFTMEENKPRSYTEGTEEERRRPLTGAQGYGDRKEEKRTLTEAQGHGEKEDISFFGPQLNFHIEESLFPQMARVKIINIISPPVLCAALLAPEEMPPSEEGPGISFRAASLANLAIRPLESGAANYSFEWRIGPLIWLPKYKGGW